MYYNGFLALTIDGYISDRYNKVNFLEKYNNIYEDYGYAKYMARQDAIIIGANTFNFLVEQGQQPFGDRKIFILSSNDLTFDEERYPHAKVYSNLSEVIEEIKLQKFENIHIEGGSLVGNFFYEGLFHELTINIIPELLGEGVPLFIPRELEKSLVLQVKSVYKYENGLLQVVYS